MSDIYMDQVVASVGGLRNNISDIDIVSYL